MKQKLISIILLTFKLGTDIILICASFILSFVVKFKLITANTEATISQYYDAMFFVTVLMLLAFYFVGLYKERKGILPELDEVIAVLAGVTIGTILVTAFSFFYKNFPGSRWVVLYAWMISAVLISFSRLDQPPDQKTWYRQPSRSGHRC
ncbi:MAG: hypothetical protein WC838_07630 [Candidatus Margulisiibacteriota bacterium]|jgi:FlaA1/EpsC-like NDP-sugar epimerase